MKLLIMGVFWTLILIHGFCDKGWKLCLTMIAIWFAGGYFFMSMDSGFVFFLSLQAVMCLILLFKTGLTGIG